MPKRLSRLIESLNILGLSGFMLLFDENERSFQPRRGSPNRKQLNAANLMRHLVDGCITGTLPRTIVVFTILPGFLEAMTLHYQALGQRLAMVRDMDINGSWRWPVLSLEQINTAREPELFLEHSISRFCAAVEKCGVSSQGLAEAMKLRGTRIIEQNAGSGYKRDLMKGLAVLAMERIREIKLTIDYIGILETMASNGVAPAEGCSLFGVGYENVFERLNKVYLQDRIASRGDQRRSSWWAVWLWQNHFLRQLMEIAAAQDLPLQRSVWTKTWIIATVSWFTKKLSVTCACPALPGGA